MIEDELEQQLRRQIRIVVEQLVIEARYPAHLVREALVEVAGELLPPHDNAA